MRQRGRSREQYTMRSSVLLHEVSHATRHQRSDLIAAGAEHRQSCGVSRVQGRTPRCLIGRRPARELPTIGALRCALVFAEILTNH